MHFLRKQFKRRFSPLRRRGADKGEKGAGREEEDAEEAADRTKGNETEDERRCLPTLEMEQIVSGDVWPGRIRRRGGPGHSSKPCVECNCRRMKNAPTTDKDVVTLQPSSSSLSLFYTRAKATAVCDLTDCSSARILSNLWRFWSEHRGGGSG
nr:PREDICTED: uncharacterized protein LOC105662904 isoform X1 [Megachile rotundata]